MTLARLRPAALVAAFAYFVLIGGTDAGQEPILRILNGLLAAAVIGWWLWRASRTADASDLLVTLGLVAFLAAAAAAIYHRLAFDAALTALGFAGLYGVLRGELADPTNRARFVNAMATINILLGAVFFIVYLEVWSAWFGLSGELAPLDLVVRVGFYRHHYLVALLLALTAPALIAWLNGRRSRLPALLGLFLTAAVILMTGSRTAWLAVLVALLVIPAGRLARTRPRLTMALAGGLVAVALAAFVVGIAEPFVNRLLVGSTVELRGELWARTLGQWLERPVLGHGPGSFPVVITLSGYFDVHPDVGPHPENAVIRLLAEGGVIGVLGLGAIAAGLWQSVRRSASQLAGYMTAGLLIFGVACLTNDLTYSPNHVAVLVTWAALAGPRAARAPGAIRTTRHLVWLAATGIAAASIFAVWAVFQLAALRYEGARDQAEGGDPAAAREELQAAIGLDPQGALYRRELGLVALDLGDIDQARAELAIAAGLNPADATALRGLALAAQGAGDDMTAEAAAVRAVEIRRIHAINSIVAAAVADRPLSDDLLADAVARDPWITAAPSWTEWATERADIRSLLLVASERTSSGGTPLSAAWLAGARGERAASSLPSSIAVAQLLDCQLDDARETIAATDLRSDVALLLLSVMLDRLEGDADESRVAGLLSLRNAPFGRLAAAQAPAANALVDIGEDARLYRRAGLPHPGGPSVPTANEGLSAWLVDPAGASLRGAPGSALAACAGSLP